MRKFKSEKKKPKMQQSWKDSMVKPGVEYPPKPKYDTKVYGTPNLDNWDHVTKKEQKNDNESPV